MEIKWERVCVGRLPPRDSFYNICAEYKDLKLEVTLTEDSKHLYSLQVGWAVTPKGEMSMAGMKCLHYMATNKELNEAYEWAKKVVEAVAKCFIKE